MNAHEKNCDFEQWSSVLLKVLPDPQKQAGLLMCQVEKDVEAALQNVSVYLQIRTTLNLFLLQLSYSYTVHYCFLILYANEILPMLALQELFLREKLDVRAV